MASAVTAQLTGVRKILTRKHEKLGHCRLCARKKSFAYTHLPLKPGLLKCQALNPQKDAQHGRLSQQKTRLAHLFRAEHKLSSLQNLVFGHYATCNLGFAFRALRCRKKTYVYIYVLPQRCLPREKYGDPFLPSLPSCDCQVQNA